MRLFGRRQFLSLVAAVTGGLLARRAPAAEDVAPLIRKLTGGAPVREGRVRLEIPRLADNGHSVPLKVAVDTPGNGRVVSITLVSDRNPRPLMATFHLGPAAGRPEIVTRVRLNGTQRVRAIAQLADGSFWLGSAEVEVTESACLDAG